MFVSNKASFYPNPVKFMFALQVPRTTKEAYELEAKVRQTKWADAIHTDLE